MKIAFVLTNCDNFGPFIVARDIINNIAGVGTQIDLYYLEETETKLDFKANLIKVDFRKTTDFSSYDVVHSHGFKADVHTYVNKKSIRGKWVCTLHQEIKRDYAMNYNLVIAMVLEKVWLFCVRRSSVIVTLTDIMADYYRKKFRRPPVIAVHNGVTPKLRLDFTPREVVEIEALKSRYTLMGMSAGLIYRKGIDKVLEAMATPEGQDLALLVMGEGKCKEELLKSATKLGVMDRCLFIGHKTNAIDYFKYFDVYMMSSRSEGFGLCVIEAASQRIPVVCNDLPVYHELFNEDEVARFQLNNPHSLAAAVHHVIKNKETYSTKVFDRYSKSYSAEIMASSYLKIYL